MSTYSELQTRIQNFFGIADTESLTVIKNEINDIIADINAEVPQSEALQASTTFTLNSGSTTIPSFPPSDLDRVVNIYLNDSDGNQAYPLEYLSRKEWNRQRYFESSGMPIYYTFWDGTYYVAPSPDSAYTGGADYFKFDSALSAAGDTSLMADHYARWERVLIDGVKSQMYSYFQDDTDMISRSYQKYQLGLSRLRSWSRRNLNKTHNASRIRSWKEVGNINRTPIQLRR